MKIDIPARFSCLVAVTPIGAECAPRSPIGRTVAAFAQAPNSGLNRDRDAAVRHQSRLIGNGFIADQELRQGSIRDYPTRQSPEVTDPKVNATIHANPAAIGKHFRKNMKIAQIAPLMESVPPRLYGGTERVVSYLTDELVQMGHDVTLFASGDSVSSAKLVGCVPTALRLDDNVSDPIPYSC